MLKALINGTSLIGYYPTTCELVEIKNRPNPPEAKPGFDYIEQVKKLDDGTYTTEWTAIERELTPEERILKELKEVKQATTDNTTAIADILGNEGGE